MSWHIHDIRVIDCAVEQCCQNPPKPSVMTWDNISSVWDFSPLILRPDGDDWLPMWIIIIQLSCCGGCRTGARVLTPWYSSSNTIASNTLCVLQCSCLIWHASSVANAWNLPNLDRGGRGRKIWGWGVLPAPSKTLRKFWSIFCLPPNGAYGLFLLILFVFPFLYFYLHIFSSSSEF